jgi:uncharacterized protein (DUF305 family)
MPNNILPQGDDQAWKKEVDRVIEQQQREIERLRDLVKANG